MQQEKLRMVHQMLVSENPAIPRIDGAGGISQSVPPGSVQRGRTYVAWRSLE